MAQPLMVNGLSLDPVVASQLGMAQYLHGAGTRKNATRESTAQLKNWLKEHQKNPYPTKAEKIMLALYSGKPKELIMAKTSYSFFLYGNLTLFQA